MGAFFTALFGFLSPVVVFFISVVSIVAFLLGALANPQGFLNQMICSAIDAIAYIFPSTPDNLKIGTMINNLGDSMPLVGRGIVREVFTSISIIIGLVSIVKIYKLLPFKAS